MTVASSSSQDLTVAHSGALCQAHPSGTEGHLHGGEVAQVDGAAVVDVEAVASACRSCNGAGKKLRKIGVIRQRDRAAVVTVCNR